MVDGVHDLDARELTLDGRGDRNSVHLVAREPEPRRPAPRKDHAEHPCRATQPSAVESATRWQPFVAAQTRAASTDS